MAIDKNIRNLVILGNGFDLAAGLKTSYEDFLSSKFQEINNKQTLKKTRSELERIYEAILDVVEPDNELTTNSELYREIASIINELKKNQFTIWEIFLISDSIGNKNWQNVEGLIERIVSSNFFELMSDEFFSEEIPFIPGASYHEIMISKIVLENYFPNFPGEYAINKFYLTELQRFEGRFKKYIKGISNDSMYNANASKLFASILTAHNSEKMANYSLLNFNYTVPQIDLNLSKSSRLTRDEKGVVVNIHGTTSPKKAIYFGVDNKSILSSNWNVRFTKAYRIMPVNNSHPDNRIDFNKIDTIKFFGHSLGQADHGYFFEIFDELHLLESSVRLQFLYTVYNKDLKDEIIDQHTNAIVHLLESYATLKAGELAGKTIVQKLFIGRRLQVIELPKLESQTNNPKSTQ